MSSRSYQLMGILPSFRQFIAYRRVSTGRQGRDGIGLDGQRAAINSFVRDCRGVLVEDYYDVATGERYWISGCKKRGDDRLYGGVTPIDEDVREEYWTTIRGQPGRTGEKVVRC